MVPTGPRQARPDDRLRTRPGISRFSDVQSHIVVRASRAPERQWLQPPLPPLKTLQILKTPALAAGAAEVEFLDALVAAQFASRAVEHHFALLHDIAVACDR